MITPELLSPAGSLKNMRYAFAYGADAVYAGQPRYSLRVRENEFNRLENIALGIQEAHALGKQFYIASNLSPHNNKVKTYIKDMHEVMAMKPDALIMSDPGLIMMVREQWPDMPIHLSVQANAVNWATVKFWQKQGLTRVILSRELSLDEIEEIKQRVPEMEIEVFVHGALCIAYSGRCLLSGYMTHRDSNQGACTNSCRWKYQAHEAVQSDSGEIIAKTPAVQGYDPSVSDSDEQPYFLLQEKNRPNDYLPAFEDEHGTYIMNSKDLRAVQHVKRLIDIGVESLKIEGRTKTHYYAARTAQVYRQAIDDAVRGKDFNMNLMNELEGLANRGFTEGFYRRHKPEEFQNYEVGNSQTSQQIFVGEATEVNLQANQLTVDVKNKFCVGDTLQLMTSKGNIHFTLNELKDKNNQAIDVAPGSGHVVTLAIPELNQLNLGSKDSVESLKPLLIRDLV
ncbi:MAG: tRNA 5-hydroxyuridine modification protein YegQ, partial [Sinobacterium sp.]|nr:tRNA 5-hydroxyuridine modification protein YegQ [Sinobacterium sp.]